MALMYRVPSYVIVLVLSSSLQPWADSRQLDQVSSSNQTPADVVDITSDRQTAAMSEFRSLRIGSDNESVHPAGIADAGVGNGSLIPANETTTLPAEWPACRLHTVDPFLHRTLAQLLNDKATLIEYRVTFVNYTSNPLTTGGVNDGDVDEDGIIYRADRWSRVTTAHGQTLLSLAFNYGVLSMMTLTFGTETLGVELADSPAGCLGSVASRRARIDAVRRLLMRDLDADGPVMTIDEARVCHETLLNDTDGTGRFRYRCCFRNSATELDECTVDIGNIWLDLLYALLFLIRLALLFFGPLMFARAVEAMAVNNIPYVVKLKDPLDKTVMFCSSQTKLPENVRARRTLDLRPMRGLSKLKDAVARKGIGPRGSGGDLGVPLGQPVKVRFSQYDISVDYKRTLTENSVDVGFFQTLFRAVFKCQLRNVGPFRQCCKADVLCGPSCTCCRSDSCNRSIPWIRCWRTFAGVLLIVLIPTPYYIRLSLFYTFEYEELKRRKDAIAEAGLTEKYDNSLIHYLLPTHWLFLVIYGVYIATAVAVGITSRSAGRRGENRFKKILVGSFKDLRRLAWTDTLSMAVANLVWPFRHFGLLGCLVGLLYWPIAVPITALVVVVYTLPTVYLTVRMAFFSKSAIVEKGRRRKKNRPYQVNVRRDRDMYRFQTDNILVLREDDVGYTRRPSVDLGNQDAAGNSNGDRVFDEEAADDDDLGLDDVDQIKPTEHIKRNIKDTISLASSIIKYQTINWRRLVEYVLAAVLCIAALYSVVIILSEVVGCLVEIAVFTIMGIIVNAGALLKYVMLVLMIFVYCCDCFNNVEKKYLKLNKALFNEVKSRIRDLSDVTSLPSFLQENRGFKSQELGEQADYESPDDVAERPSRHWMINDLVLFVDSEDTPRIPRHLFDEVCNIRVAGVPGPVFRGHVDAITQLAKIVLFIAFVFLIVLSFGAVYRVSSTNQMLAAMVGGFLPMMLRTFLAPPAPDVELGTVSFKSKMDEVIKNFCQYWPMYDLPFQLAPPPSEDDGDDENNKAPNAPGDNSAPKADGEQEVRLPDNCLSVSNSYPAVTPPSYLAPPVAVHPDAMTYVCVDSGFGAGHVYGFGCDPPLSNHLDIDSCDGGTNARPSPPKPQRQKSKVVRLEEPCFEDVDVVIYLPDQYDEPWLDEWSDIISLRSFRSRTNSASAGNLSAKI